MTLIIVFGAALLVGIALIVWNYFDSNPLRDWNLMMGIPLTFAASAFLVAACIHLPFALYDSKVAYQCLSQQKKVIETVLENGSEMDKINVLQEVNDYNDQVIKIQTNLAHPVFRDYYSKNVDWSSLEVIEMD